MDDHGAGPEFNGLAAQGQVVGPAAGDLDRGKGGGPLLDCAGQGRGGRGDLLERTEDGSPYQSVHQAVLDHERWGEAYLPSRCGKVAVAWPPAAHSPYARIWRLT